jgi:hypothetical protein
MYKFYSFVLIMLFIISQSACSHSQSEQHTAPPAPYQNLSTKEQTKAGQASSSTPLSFEDFTERWNSLSEEQLSTLYIKNLEDISSNDGTIYRAIFSDKLELLIFVSNGLVRQLEMISSGKSVNEIYSMLSGWSQMADILHPNREGQDVDALFHSIGVGPNADLSKVTSKSFTYYDLFYEVIPTDIGYTLRISYDQQQ